MASPILALASIMREANLGGHGAPPNLILSQSPEPSKPQLARSEKQQSGGLGDGKSQRYASLLGWFIGQSPACFQPLSHVVSFLQTRRNLFPC